MTDESVLETMMESHIAVKPVMTMCVHVKYTHYTLFGQG